MSQKSTGLQRATYAYACKHWLTFPHRQWEKGYNLCKSATRAAEQNKFFFFFLKKTPGLSLPIPDNLKHIYKDIGYTHLKQKTCAVLSIWINATIGHFPLPIFNCFLRAFLHCALTIFCQREHKTCSWELLKMFTWILPVVLRCHSLLKLIYKVSLSQQDILLIL